MKRRAPFLLSIALMRRPQPKFAFLLVGLFMLFAACAPPASNGYNTQGGETECDLTVSNAGCPASAVKVANDIRNAMKTADGNCAAQKQVMGNLISYSQNSATPEGLAEFALYAIDVLSNRMVGCSGSN